MCVKRESRERECVREFVRENPGRESARERQTDEEGESVRERHRLMKKERV